MKAKDAVRRAARERGVTEKRGDELAEQLERELAPELDAIVERLAQVVHARLLDKLRDRVFSRGG